MITGDVDPIAEPLGRFVHRGHEPGEVSRRRHHNEVEAVEADIGNRENHEKGRGEPKPASGGDHQHAGPGHENRTRYHTLCRRNPRRDR